MQAEGRRFKSVYLHYRGHQSIVIGGHLTQAFQPARPLYGHRQMVRRAASSESAKAVHTVLATKERSYAEAEVLVGLLAKSPPESLNVTLQ